MPYTQEITDRISRVMIKFIIKTVFNISIKIGCQYSEIRGTNY